MWPRRAGILSAFALLYAGLNALLPLQVDDAAYVCYARQIAAHPLDPYGFAIQWYDAPEPANDLLAPPVFPYSLAIAVRLFGDRPAVWKLALLPWSLILAFAVHAMLRRFAPGLELPLTAFVLFSAALLPSLNLMLDIPALALSLAAVYTFLRACDTGSAARVVAAGLLAAMAMQTKYTGALAVGAIFAAAWIYRRPGLGIAAAAVAVVGFSAWEAFVAQRYGRSHFLNALDANGTTLLEKANLVPLFFSQFGGLAPALVLLGLAATGAPARLVVVAGCTVVAGYVSITLLDACYSSVVRPSPKLFGASEPAPWNVQLAEILFDAVAAVGVLVLVRVVLAIEAGQAEADRADTRFLLAWLGLELAGYLALSPFPAARRVFGALIVVTILFGRLASRSCATAARRRLLNGVVCFSVVLGLAYWGIDWLGARAYERGAEESAAFVRANGGGRAWYTGRWAFRYYAERRGLWPVVPRYQAPSSYVKLPPGSRLQHGDWLVVAEDDFQKSGLDFANVPREEVGRIVIDDPVPLRLVPCFFGGRTPLEHRERPRLSVQIYRVLSDCEAGLVSGGESGTRDQDHSGANGSGD